MWKAVFFESQGVILWEPRACITCERSRGISQSLGGCWVGQSKADFQRCRRGVILQLCSEKAGKWQGLEGCAQGVADFCDLHESWNWDLPLPRWLSLSCWGTFQTSPCGPTASWPEIATCLARQTAWVTPPCPNSLLTDLRPSHLGVFLFFYLA